MILYEQNSTTPIGVFLDSLVAAMNTGFPARNYDRTLIDFNDRDEAELSEGVFTFLADGLPDVDDYVSYLNVMLVGQVFGGEDVTGHAIEELELALINEMLALKKSGTPNVDISSIQQSRQLEVPYGWTRAQLRIGPLDLTPPAPDTVLDDFVTFHADWDIPPHETGTEHTKWLEEPPDHTNSAPDASDDVTLEQ